MCGIIATTGKEIPPAALEMLGKRGPDDRGVTSFPHATLGHTRLAIIDLSDLGHQPMRDNARNIAITFNGEIYNYKELRKELEEKDHHFTSQSDTEVILKAYIEYGDECPKHLDGQFAFAIWDEGKQRMFMARDRFGEKPLYWARTPQGQFIAASEIKALLAAGVVHGGLDPVSIDNYLSLGYVPPWRSIYKNIQPLPPAHCAVWEKGAFRQERYWWLSKEPVKEPRAEAAQRVRTLLADSVKSRMTADVEVGAFLSGGIDSGIIVRLAAQETPRPLKTFSAGFEGIINELPHAQEVAMLAKTDHRAVQVQTDLARVFMETMTYLDEPFGDSSIVPTGIISQLAQEKVKVVLSGDGGDELFWGYGHYTKYRNLPKLTQLRNALSGSDPYRYYKSHTLSNFSAQERSKLLKDAGSMEHDLTDHIDLSEAETPQEKINLVDFYLGLPGDMLAKVDRASMMHSLEVRSPFLNPTLAQFAYNLPAEYKTDGRRGKILLGEAFGDLLPPSFFTRKKQGFGAPVKQWLMRPEFKALVDEWLLKDPLVSAYLNPQSVRNYAERFYQGEEGLEYKLWLLLTLEAWLRSHELS